MDKNKGNWNLIFWMVFIVLGIILILASRFDTFLMGLLMGLVVIILGIQKIAEDKNFRYLHMKQNEVDKSLRDMSSFIDKTYKKVDIDEEDEPIVSEPSYSNLDSVKKEIDQKIDDDIEKLAKKMLQIENKLNQLSRTIVDNWGRIEKDTKVDRPKVISNKQFKDNAELKKKLEKVMRG